MREAGGKIGRVLSGARTNLQDRAGIRQYSLQNIENGVAVAAGCRIIKPIVRVKICHRDGVARDFDDSNPVPLNCTGLPGFSVCDRQSPVIERIKKFILAKEAPDGGDKVSVEAAAAALMIEAAFVDGTFDDAEQATIGTLLSSRFDISASEVEELIDEGTEVMAQAADLYGFTRVVQESFDHDERIRMIEMMWEVSYADGVLHDYEANLLRRITGLLHVSDRECGDARKRVLERLDISGA